MAEHSNGVAWRTGRARKPKPLAAARALALEAKPAGRSAGRVAKRSPPPERSAIPASVAKALVEITTVAAVSLHREAAHAWAARAVACYRVCLGKADLQEGLSYLYLGEHYREAALAHAAFGEAWRPLQPEIRAVMDADRTAAGDAMRQRSLADPPARP